MTLFIRVCAAFLCALATTILISGCSLLGDRHSGDVRVKAAAPKLIITNGTDETVYTFVVGRQLSARINWAATVGGEGIAPRARERLSYEEIGRDEGEKEVIVYWWHAVEKDGERVAGEVHSINTKL